MSKFVIIPFPNEAAAYGGIQALKELDQAGDLSLYGYSVLSKSADGRLDVKDAAGKGPLGLALGALTGGLIGLFGGPAGWALGVAGGALVGGVTDVALAGAPLRFAERVALDVKPGHVAIVAEIDEDWTTPLDSRLAELGATAIREWRSNVEDAQIEEDARNARLEMEQLRNEAREARAAQKEKLEGKVDAARTRLTELRDQAAARLESIKSEAEAKIAHAEQQMKTASAERKAEIEARIARIKADARQRSDKLSAAWSLTKEALL
ncbi:DUF1269 domain-containing protein [Albidovulum sp.]|uniref:DUF1269 domain-containing protein n=1 Tax=Albidovulum sp. TaxID=1872424 RepID=UPI0039B97E97